MPSPPSPLTGATDCRRVHTVRAADVATLYRRLRGLDVAAEFPTDEVTLWHDEPVGFHFFDPMCAGSARFYADLTASPRYVADKQEYRVAARFVAADRRVLDVGCGWGLFAAHVPAAHYQGLEPSEASATVARERGLDVRRDAVEDVARRDGAAWDVVTSFQVLEHVTDPAGFFAACAACVRPGGLLVISVPNADSFMSVYENNFLNLPPHHVTWWTARSLLHLGERGGLAAIAVHHDTATRAERAMTAAAIAQDRLNRLLGRPPRLVRTGTRDRLLHRVCGAAGRLVSRGAVPVAVAPRGQSITVVYRKPS